MEGRYWGGGVNGGWYWGGGGERRGGIAGEAVNGGAVLGGRL